jgi:hypothetical protein
MAENESPRVDAINAGARAKSYDNGADHRLSREDCKESVDLREAERFLALLDPTASKHTFQCFDDTEAKDKSLARIVHGSLALCADRLIELNEAGAGVYVTVNRTNGRGRKADNIVAVRSLFVDLDGAPLQPVLDHHIKPQIVVETSPGKYHVYWLVENIPLEHFSDIQVALAERFNADPGVKDLSRVLRLPGFFHRKRDPYQVRIIAINDAPRYGGELFERRQEEPHIPHEQEPVTDREILLAMATLKVIPPSTERKNRNVIGMAVYRASAGHPAAFEAWCKWLRRSNRYSEKHAKQRWTGFGKYLANIRHPKKPVGLGTLIFKADSVDPEWRHRPIFDLLNGGV